MRPNRAPRPEDLKDETGKSTGEIEAALRLAKRTASLLTGRLFSLEERKLEAVALGQTVLLPEWPVEIKAEAIEELGVVFLPDLKAEFAIEYRAGLREDDWPAIYVELVKAVAFFILKDSVEAKDLVADYVRIVRATKRKEEDLRNDYQAG